MKSFSVSSTSLNQRKSGGSGGYSIKYKTIAKYNNYGIASIASIASTTSIPKFTKQFKVSGETELPFILILQPNTFSGPLVDDRNNFRSRREPSRKAEKSRARRVAAFHVLRLRAFIRRNARRRLWLLARRRGFRGSRTLSICWRLGNLKDNLIHLLSSGNPINKS
jgi:hypothetical protein